MALKGQGTATDWREIDRWDRGAGWLAYPDEPMQRASHAVEDGDQVWLVDPVDAPGLDEFLSEMGRVAGVVVLLDRHARDAQAIANRHDVAVHVPGWMDGIEQKIRSPIRRIHTQLGDTGFELYQAVNNRFWQEAVLYDDDSGTLFVPEALGTADFFLAEGERLGVHPALRLFPPRRLGRLSPDRLLVGHGTGIHDDATGEIHRALAGSRSRAPSLYAKSLRRMLPV